MIDNNNEDLLKQPCTICFESLDLNQANINDKGMALVQCQNCSIQSHQRCIGIDNIDSESKEFMCNPCSNKAKNYHCDICLSSQGYMKQYKSKKYVHVFCALFNDVFSIEDFSLMKLNPSANIDKLLKSSTGKKALACSICNKRGGLMIKCFNDSCGKLIHLYCGISNQYNAKISSPDSNDHWLVKIIPNISNPNLTTEDLLSKEVEVRPLKIRSGIIMINCPEHIGSIEYCLCKSSSANDDMICCDYCDTWFHMKCLNMTETNITKYNNSNWYCQPCTKWLIHKQNRLNEVNEITPAPTQNNKIVYQLYVYKISDLIYMGSQFIIRANSVINEQCTISAFTEVLSTGNFVPFLFESNSIIDPLNKKLSNYKSISHTKYPDDIIQELNYYLSSDINEDPSINELTYFNKLLNDINSCNKLLEEEYLSIGFIYQSSVSQSDATNKISWCTKALTILINSTTKSSSSPSKCKIETVRELQSCLNFTEPYIINLNNSLTQISTQYSNWINEVKSLLSTHTENSNQLDKYDKEINQQIKREKNPITKMSIKKDKILSHLSIKIQKTEIDQLLSSGRELAIDASHEIFSIENDCLKPLNELLKQINAKKISYDQAKEILKTMVSGTIVSNDILKEFNEDYFNAKKWEYNSIDILTEKRIDLLQDQIDNFNKIKYISDNTLNNLLIELCDFRDKMANLKELCIKTLAEVNNIKELENIRELLKKNNLNDGDMLREIEEKINYVNHMSNIFKMKQYSKKDIEVLRDSLIKYGLINDVLDNEINLRLSLIDNCDNQVQEKLLSPIQSDQGENNNSAIGFNLEDIRSICNQTKQNNIIIANSDILDTCMTLWKLNDEFDVNSNITKLNDDEEYLKNLIQKHANIVNPLVNSRFNLKITEFKHQILFSKGIKLLSSKDNADVKLKLCLSDLKIFFDDIDHLNTHFDNIYVELPEDQRNELRTVLLSLKQWSDNYNALLNEVYSNYIEDKVKCKEILSLLKSTTNPVIEYVDLSNQMHHFEEIEQLLMLNDEIFNYINLNKNGDSSDNKPSITQLRASYEEFSQRIKDKTILKSLSLLKEEIIKINMWLECYSEYQNNKRKRIFEQISLTILENMLTESKSFICNIAIEQAAISSDLSATKNFLIVSKTLLSDSDPFSHHNIQLSSNSIYQLNQIITDLNSNKVLISDKALIDNIKSLDWIIKIKSAMSFQVEFHTINKLFQEGLLLKRYNEIQKQDYIQEIFNQITLSKNYKELADLITKTKQKQISQEEFDSIVSEYNSKCRIVFIEEKDTIDSVIRMRGEFERVYENYYKTKAGLQDYEKLFNDIIKFPIRLDSLIERIDDVLVVTKLLQREVKKLCDQKVKNKLSLTQDKVYSLVEKCKKNNASFPEGEQLIKAYTTCVDNINKLSQMIKEPNSDLYQMIRLKDNITIHCNNDDENEINKVIWKRKYEELILKTKPTKLMVEHLLSEIKEINIEFDEKENELLISLRELNENGNVFIEKISQCCTVNELNSLKNEIKTNCEVDLSQYIVEHETKLNLKIFPSKTFLNYKKKKDVPGVKESLITVSDDMPKENLIIPETIKLGNAELNTSTNAVTIRSKRNVKRKINSDYYYEKEFVDDFENKIAVRNQIEEQIEPDKAKESVVSGSESQNASSVVPIKSSVDLDQGKKEKLNIQQNDINARIENILLNKKTKRPSAAVTPPQNDQLKISIQKNTILQFENICKENPVFNSKGMGFISTLAKKLEEELSTSYPKIDSEYQKVLSNMLKTVKELGNFKKVSSLVVKGKVTLFKVAKFPYGLKYIQKLQRIEDSVKKKQRQKEEETIQTMFTGVKELYSSLLVPIKPKEQKERLVSSINDSLAKDDEEDDDNNSLKSLPEEENIRFSPGGGVLNKNKALTTSTTIQSSLSPQKPNANDKNEKMYDPFNNGDMFDSFAHKKKKFAFPIFYDPERKKILTEITHPDISKKVPENSILKIWNGKLIINKAELSNVSFLSTNQYDLFEQFPQFASEIVISNRAKTNEVIPYVEKQVNNKQKIVLYGWLEIESNSNEKYLALSEEYDKNDRCACLILHNIKLYIFSLSPKYPKFNTKFRSECYFYNDVLMSQMDKLLVFVLIANKTDLTDIGKRISPIVLKRKEITMSQENDNMSPITSEDENEQEGDYDEKLEKLLETNDLKLLDEYVNTHFSNLSNNEIAEKLMAFDEERRTKLLMLITQYQMNSSPHIGENNPNDDNQYMNQDQLMEIDNIMNSEISNQGGNSQSVQKRFEEVINEEQMRRMSQLNQMQQNPSNLIPPYYNPSMMGSNPSMYPMMNEYNQMMMHQQHQNQRQQQQLQQRPQHSYQRQHQQPNMHQRYSNNQ